MDKEAAKRRLHELVSGNPDRVRIIRSEHEIESLNMDKVVAGGGRSISLTTTTRRCLRLSLNASPKARR